MNLPILDYSVDNYPTTNLTKCRFREETLKGECHLGLDPWSVYDWQLVMFSQLASFFFFFTSYYCFNITMMSENSLLFPYTLLDKVGSIKLVYSFQSDTRQCSLTPLCSGTLPVQVMYRNDSERQCKICTKALGHFIMLSF